MGQHPLDTTRQDATRCHKNIDHGLTRAQKASLHALGAIESALDIRYRDAL